MTGLKDDVLPHAVPRGPEDAELERLAELLEPLASPARLKLLRFLTRPHYLEEVASHLGISRQGARKHLDKLAEIGAIERKAGTRDGVSVTDYIISPRAIFLVYDEFEKLASLQRDEQEPDVMLRTIAEPGRTPDARQAAGPCFRVVRGPSPGRRLPLRRDASREWLIGRDERADFLVDHDPYISNRHAEVRWDGSRFVLTDLRSTNGTYHNWSLLTRGASAPLRHGDVVGVGRTLLLLWDGTA